MLFADTVLSAEVPTSTVAKKRGIDQPIRTKRTESVTDWANRMGAIGFLGILNTEAWENRNLAMLSNHVTLAVYTYYDTF